MLLGRMGCLLGALIVWMLLGLPRAGNAQTADLSPKAQEPFSRGLAAAQQQEWRIAIRHFLDAHKADPDATQVWFNLGLASSKLPGWELRAIAWLKAYQEAVPNAPNVKAIQELVTGLGARFEGNIGRLTEQLVPAARALSKKDKDLDIREKYAPYYGVSLGDRLELPYATFLLIRDDASTRTVEPTRPTGIVCREGSAGCNLDKSHFAIALARAGQFEKAVALAEASTTTIGYTGSELIEYLLSQSRLKDAINLVRVFTRQPKNVNDAHLGRFPVEIKIACKAREVGRSELVSEMFSAVKDAVARKNYSLLFEYFDFALWLDQAEEINRSYGLLKQFYAKSGYDFAEVDRRRSKDVGKLPPSCRAAWWLSGQRRVYLLNVATKGVEIRFWDWYEQKTAGEDFDETMFKEATESARQIKHKNSSDGALSALLLGLAESAYVYRNINP